jgi:hypothetical protein
MISMGQFWKLVEEYADYEVLIYRHENAEGRYWGDDRIGKRLSERQGELRLKILLGAGFESAMMEREE